MSGVDRVPPVGGESTEHIEFRDVDRRMRRWCNVCEDESLATATMVVGNGYGHVSVALCDLHLLRLSQALEAFVVGT